MFLMSKRVLNLQCEHKIEINVRGVVHALLIKLLNYFIESALHGHEIDVSGRNQQLSLLQVH